MPENTHLTYASDDEVIAALFRAKGNVSKTAKLLGLRNVHELRSRINKKPELKEAKLEAFEQQLDEAEAKVTTKMTKSDARWLLERKGRSRGYGNVLTTANLNVDVSEYDLSAYPLEDRKKLLEMISGNNSTDTE